jgi:hypothetical protein
VSEARVDGVGVLKDGVDSDALGEGSAKGEFLLGFFGFYEKFWCYTARMVRHLVLVISFFFLQKCGI